MYQVWIWGIAGFYNSIRNSLEFEEMKHNIKIEGFIVTDRPPFDFVDGKPVIQASQIGRRENTIDYIIVASDRFQEILVYAKKLGIDENIMIWGKVFRLPGFDFIRYIKVFQKKISIVADSCFGGRLYHALGLKFYSPFINMRIYSADFFLLAEHIEEVIHNPIKEYCGEMVSIAERNCEYAINDQMYVRVPKAYLDCGNGRKAITNFVHGDSFLTEQALWVKRAARFQFDNYIIMMVLTNEIQIEKFLALPMENKIGFCYREVNSPYIVFLKEYEKIKSIYCYDFRQYVHDLVTGERVKIVPSIDLLKLLSGEEYYRIS